MLAFFVAAAVTSLSKMDAPPPAAREFRGVWVATVDHIDWPPRNVFDPSRQKEKLIAILDEAQKLHFNAVVFQVRPMGDALYASRYEPWSEFLTGKQGEAPSPYWDPLAFAVKEAHARGLELHAWFNPYRVWHPAAKGSPASDSLIYTHPSWVRDYGQYKWLDPGAVGVRQWTEKVILDVVKRYDIDGVHLDDYFYPYPERDASKHDIPFPDDASWETYEHSGGGLSRDEWRRSNVNDLVADLYKKIKVTKPWVKFGISPFGIYRPGVPPTIKAGIDQYAQLYADPLKWFQDGWCDYLTPQLYWPINRKAQSYTVLANWWAQQDKAGRHLWIGNYASGINSEASVKELLNQIAVTREIPGAGGNVFFSMQAFMEDRHGVDEALLDGPYRDKALVPASSWLASAAPAEPSIVDHGDDVEVLHKSSSQHQFALYLKRDGTWHLDKIWPADYTDLRIKHADECAVSAIDRYGNESGRVVFRP